MMKMISKVFKIFENNLFFVQKQVYDMLGCVLYSVRLSNGILPCDFEKAETNMILEQARSFQPGVCYSLVDIEGLNSSASFLIQFLAKRFERVSWSDPCCGSSAVLLAFLFWNYVACYWPTNEGDSYQICTVL